MKLATIEQIVDIKPHPDPEVERLEIAQVLGYTCAVAKGQYQPGEKCILIQPDSVLPDCEWTEFYKKFSTTRVKAQKIRGFYSFGIVEKVSLLNDEFDIGTDVSELLGIIKYEPPITDEGGKQGLPFNIIKTDESNWQNVLDLQLYMGQVVDVTLKIDGSSCSLFWKDGEFGVLSRNQWFDENNINKYTSIVQKYDLKNKLTSYCERHQVNICLRGELFGQGVQSSKNNPHSKLPIDIAFFNVWLIDEVRYTGIEHPHYFVNICNELNLPTVPILERAKLTKDLIEKYSDEEKLNGGSFEGVVIKGKDFSFKVINKPYDSRK